MGERCVIRESEVERMLVSEAARIGGRAYKWVSPGNNGVPDRIVILPGGRVCFVELKTPVGVLSPVQKVQIRTLKSLGTDTDTVYGLKGLAEWFEDRGYPESAARVREKLERMARGALW